MLFLLDESELGRLAGELAKDWLAVRLFHFTAARTFEVSAFGDRGAQDLNLTTAARVDAHVVLRVFHQEIA